MFRPLLVCFSSLVRDLVSLRSFAGGGIRGLVELYTLKEIFGEEAKIGQKFDLIIGASTGGILALSFGLLGYTVKECIDLYEGTMAKFFSAKRRSGCLDYGGDGMRVPTRVAPVFVAKICCSAPFPSFHDSAGIEAALQEVFGDKPLDHQGEGWCHVGPS